MIDPRSIYREMRHDGLGSRLGSVTLPVLKAFEYLNRHRLTAEAQGTVGVLFQSFTCLTLHISR